ncbi:MAG TPA: HPr kinase/phosphorylase [Caulobacter sp.]|nr:HPr kinase/phosphorylase [Caulobacter sp.]
MIRHADLVALRIGAEWRGVLIEGPSGAGKSDLALRAIGEGFRLVADDRVLVWASAGRNYGRAPDTLAGILESRGAGVLPVPAIAFCEVALAVRCEASPDAVERMPIGETLDLPGGPVPLRPLWPFDRAAPAKLRRIIEHLGHEH